MRAKVGQNCLRRIEEAISIAFIALIQASPGHRFARPPSPSQAIARVIHEILKACATRFII